LPAFIPHVPPRLPQVRGVLVASEPINSIGCIFYGCLSLVVVRAPCMSWVRARNPSAVDNATGASKWPQRASPTQPLSPDLSRDPAAIWIAGGHGPRSRWPPARPSASPVVGAILSRRSPVESHEVRPEAPTRRRCSQAHWPSAYRGAPTSFTIGPRGWDRAVARRSSGTTTWMTGSTDIS